MSGSLAHRMALMARMQIEHNQTVHPLWEAQGHAYFRAIWVECAELLDHYGWKWWKHQQRDLEQVKLEIVDIWHFGLSDLIRARRVGDDRCDPDVIAAIERVPAVPDLDFPASVEHLASCSLETRSFDVDAFLGVLAALPMSFEELFHGYVGKNVLNNFRQAHGYRTGTYRKEWGGREDNEHLMELVVALDPTDPSFPDALYGALERRYGELEAGAFKRR